MNQKRTNLIIFFSCLLFSGCPSPDFTLKVDPEIPSATLPDSLTHTDADPQEDVKPPMADIDREDLAKQIGRLLSEGSQVFQLSTVLDQGQVVYDFQGHILNSAQENIISFLKIVSEESKVIFVVNVLEHYLPVYRLEFYATFKLTSEGLQLRLRSIHEKAFGSHLKNVFTGSNHRVTQLDNVTSLTIQQALHFPHKLFKELLGEKYTSTISTSFELTENHYDSYALKLGNPNGREYIFKPSQDNEFTVTDPLLVIDSEHVAIQFSASQTPWNRPFTLYESPTNRLNNSDKDDVYLYEPARWFEVREDGATLIVSSAEIQAFLSEREEVLFEDLLRFQGFPQAVTLKVFTEGRNGTQLKTEEAFDSSIGEVGVFFSREELENINRVHMNLLNENGEAIWECSLPLPRELS